MILLIEMTCACLSKFIFNILYCKLISFLFKYVFRQSHTPNRSYGALLKEAPSLDLASYKDSDGVSVFNVSIK